MRAAIELSPGDLVDGRYRIVEPLGAGGAGAVYEAIDESTTGEVERVAIKVLSAAERFDEGQRSGLELEFSLLARMNHPNVVAALAIGVTEEGTGYLVEELVVGPTLEAARSLLEPRDYFWIAHGILEGLAHVHRRGWVHHDIKPANILIANAEAPPSEWVPKIADLGVASLSGSDPEGRVSGTVPFLSPERLVGRLADPRSDVWALGMSLLFCISGTLPVDVDSVRAAARILRQGSLPALRDLRPDAPLELEAVIGRMLSRDREARYRDGTDALAGLRREMSRAGLVVPTLPASTLAQSPAMVGRDAVLAQALRRLEPSRSLATRVVALRGEAGSGRTRILREVALEVQLRGARAVHVDPGVGRAPWIRVLTRLGKKPASLQLEEIASSLIDAFETEPVVLLVDDVDARDSVARRLLERLRGALGASTHIAGVVVTGNVASDWSDIEQGEHSLTLEPLGDRDMEKLIRSALGTDVAPQAVVRLVDAARGNPARVVAAMTNAVRSGMLNRVAGVWELEGDFDIVDTDIEAHREAAAALGDSSRDLLAVLAVLGPSSAPVEIEVARAVAELERGEIGPALSALCHLGLAGLSGTGDPHATTVALAGHVDQVALEGIAAERVRELHARAWSTYQGLGSDDPALLARHAWGAKLDDEASQLTVAATTSALAECDYAAALALTDHLDEERLAVLSDDAVERIRVARASALVELSRPLEGAVLAGLVLAARPDNLHAAQVVVRAAVAAGDAVRAQRALDIVVGIHQSGAVDELDNVELAALGIEVARVNRRPEDVKAAATEALATIGALQSGSLPEGHTVTLTRARGRVYSALGASLALGGDVEAGKPILEKALAAFTEIADHARIAEVSAFLAAAADMSGNDVDRTIHLNRGLENAERAGADSSAARLLNIRGLSLLWCGRTEEAAEAFEEAERKARLPGLYKVVSAVSGNLVVVHRRAGHYGRALEAARRSLRVKRPLGDRPGIIATTLNLSDVMLDIGAFNLAAAAGRRVVRDSVEVGNRRVEVNGRVTLATALIACGKIAEARETLGWITEELENLEHQAALEVELSIAAVLAGERQLSLAADRYRGIEKAARERDEPFIAAAAAYERGVLLGEVGAPDLRRAIEAAARCSARHYLWRARAQLGLILTTTGDSRGAGAEFARASETLGEVIENLPSRHRETYLGAGDRVALVAAMRAGAGITKQPSPTGRRPQGSEVTTAVEVPSESAKAVGVGTPNLTVDRLDITQLESSIPTVESDSLDVADLEETVASQRAPTDIPDQE